MKYELRAQEYLNECYGRRYIPSPWFQYQEVAESRVRYCQPDGLLFSPDLSRLTIVEIKLKHTEKAWWQLRHKYGPILADIYPWMELSFVELVQWYDMAIPFPELVKLRPAVGMAKTGEIQVTIWKP